MTRRLPMILSIVGVLYFSGCTSVTSVEPESAMVEKPALPGWAQVGSIIDTGGVSTILGYGEGYSRVAAIERAEEDVVRQLALYVGVDVATASVSRSQSEISSFTQMRSQGYVDGLNTRSHVLNADGTYSAYLLSEVGKDDLAQMRKDRRTQYERRLQERLALTRTAQQEMQHSMTSGQTPLSAFASGEFKANITTTWADAEQTARNGARLVALQQLSAILFGQTITATSFTDGVRLQSQTQGSFRSVELGTWVWREENALFARVDVVGFRQEHNDDSD